MANALWSALSVALGLTRRAARDEGQGRAVARLHPVGDGLVNVAAGLGTERDKRFYSEWASQVGQSQQQLGNMYRQSWLARRIVETPADDSTRAWVSMSWDGYDEDGEGGVKAVELAETRYRLRPSVNVARRLGRLYGGAAIVMVLKGDTRLSMATPLDVTKITKDQLLRLHVLDRYRLVPVGGIDDNMASPNFGLPLSYRIVDTSTVVHWSRLVRFNGRALPFDLWTQNQCWDDSVLMAVMDSVKNYETATGGAASMIFEASVDILKIEGLARTLSTGAGGEQQILNRLLSALTMKSFNRTLVIDKDQEEFSQKTLTFAGINDLIANFVVDLCGAAEIPTTILYGQSAPGMNSTGESDIRNYYDRISAGQESEMRPQLATLFEAVIRSGIGRMPENFSFKFNSLWQVSDKEKADIAKVRAETDAIYLGEGVLTEGLIAKELKDRDTYRTMEDEDVALAEDVANEPEPEPPAPPPGRNGKPVAAALRDKGSP